MTVTEMLQKMPAWELTEWVGYHRVLQQEKELEQGRQSYGG